MNEVAHTLPLTVRVEPVGVDIPIPTFPLALITINSVIVEVAVPVIL